MMRCLVLAWCLGWCAVAAATDPAPGTVVDPAPILALPAPADTLVDIRVEKPLLKALVRRYAKTDPTLAAVLDQLTLMRSVTVTFSSTPPAPRITSAVADLEQQLTDRGWTRLAQIQDPELQLTALVHLSDEVIDGLVVVSVSGNQVVFTHLAGSIDLVEIARLRSTLSLPGIERLPARVPPSPEPAGVDP